MDGNLYTSAVNESLLKILIEEYNNTYKSYLHKDYLICSNTCESLCNISHSTMSN